MLGAIKGSILSYFFDWLLQDTSWVLQADLLERRKNVVVCEMFLSLDFDWSWILNLRVNPCFGSIINPLSNKYLILLTKEIGALPFPFIIDPMTFEMITTSLGQYTIATPLSHIPHSFIDIAIRVNHPSFSMGKIVHPHTIITIPALIKHRSSSLLWIVLPITCILSPQLIFWISNPKCALTVPLVLRPSALILIPIRIILNSKAIFFIIFPITNKFVRSNPFIGFLWSILIKGLFLFRSINTLTQ